MVYYDNNIHQWSCYILGVMYGSVKYYIHLLYKSCLSDLSYHFHVTFILGFYHGDIVTELYKLSSVLTLCV